jgi:rare lipoprotein A
MPPARAHTAMLVAALCGASACAAPAASAQAPASLVTAPGALRGEVTRVSGTLPSLSAGARVRIQRLDAKTGWVNEATTTADAGGAFVARWRPKVVGRFTVRAQSSTGQIRAAGGDAPTAQLTVYRPARTTWYGPGLYGRTTACGQVLSRRLLGLAHRTLPCGTPVDVYLAGRSITVPVVDRGPFANGAHYDLTSAVAQQIGLTETTTVGFVPRRGATMEPPLLPPAPFEPTGGATPGS